MRPEQPYYTSKVTMEKTHFLATFLFFALFSSLVFTSCGSDDDDNGNVGNVGGKNLKELVVGKWYVTHTRYASSTEWKVDNAHAEVLHINADGTIIATLNGVQRMAGSYVLKGNSLVISTEGGSTTTYELLSIDYLLAEVAVYSGSTTEPQTYKRLRRISEQDLTDEGITGISFPAPSATMKQSATAVYKLKVEPLTVYKPNITFTSSNEDVLEVVSSIGAQVTVKALKAGEAKLTARSTNGHEASVVITVENDVSIFETKTIVVGDVEFKMIAVEGGRFLMGANYSEPAFTFEMPKHDVGVTDFYIGETEVTQALWKTVMGSNPSSKSGNKLPVENVSWEDCQSFLEKLNAMTGLEFRLPLEAEWEFAARGGLQSKGYLYPGSNGLDNIAWYAENSDNKPHEVATKAANELGLYDMSGNVYEWCNDGYDPDYYSKSDMTTNPRGNVTDNRYVLRGGYFASESRYCHVHSRYADEKYDKTNYTGLRLAIKKK